MGRKKVQQIREVAAEHGWLDPEQPLPADGELTHWLRPAASRSSSTSLLEAFREEVTRWWKQGIQGTTIHSALARKHGFVGSYSSVRRFLQSLDPGPRDPTMILEFAPGEAAQVDFGSGPRVLDRELGEAAECANNRRARFLAVANTSSLLTGEQQSRPVAAWRPEGQPSRSEGRGPPSGQAGEPVLQEIGSA